MQKQENALAVLYILQRGDPVLLKYFFLLLRLCSADGITLLGRVAGETPAGYETSGQPGKLGSSFFPLADLLR